MSLFRLRNFIIVLAMILLAFIIQCTVLSRLTYLSCAPNFLLALTFIYGYSNGKTSGMFIGFFAGLLLDVFFCEFIGFNALIFVIIGFVSGMWNKYFYSDNIYIPLLLLVGSDLFYCLINFFFWFVLRARINIGYYFGNVIIPEFLMTLAAGIIIYKPVTILNNKLRIES